MVTLTQSLQNHSLAMLRVIAKRNSVALHSNVGRQVVEQLSAVLSDAEHLSALIASCSGQAQYALQSLLRAGGSGPLATFERRFGPIRTFGPGRLERENPHQQSISASEELWYCGLVFRAFAETPNGLTEFLYVPSDLAALLPAPDQPASSAFHVPQDLSFASQDAAVQLAGSCFLHDACTLLCLVQAGEMRLAQADSPSIWGSNSLYALNQLLLRPAANLAHVSATGPGSALALLLALAQDLDWLRVQGRRVRVDAAPARAWLEAPRSQQRRMLLDAWARSPTWNDLCRTPTLSCEDTGSWRNDPAGTRQRLLPLLTQLTPAAWHRLDDLAAAVKQEAPDFQRPDGDYDTWYVRRRDAPAYLRGYERWDEVEGQLLRFILAGPLHWLGATDLGLEAAGAVSAVSFRLTTAGQAWLAGELPPPEPAAGSIVVLPDFTVLAPLDAPLLDRFRVARFTSWEANPLSDRQGVNAQAPSGETSQSVFRYRITQTGLRKAARQGIDIDRVLTFLHERASQPLPPNVVAALRRWRA